MTQEEMVKVTEFAKRASLVTQELMARVQQAEKIKPSPEVITGAVDQLIAYGVLDAATKQAAVNALGDHTKALDSLVNLAAELNRTVTQDKPGAPLINKKASNNDSRTVEDDYNDFAEKLNRLVATGGIAE